MDFLKEQSILLRLFLRRELGKYLPAAALTLLLSAVVGCASCLMSPEIGDEMVTAFRRLTEESGAISSSGSLSPVSILYHNWMAVISIIFYGVLPLCYFSALTLSSNGVLLGVVVAHYHNQDLSAILALVGILPHGIFELPALILAGASGIYLCRRITDRVTKRVQTLNGFALLEDLMRVLLFLIFPLLLAAALVECYITPMIFSMFL